ncbi:MAG TPA: tyrosine-type recombinase/integrase, partial [Thermodesulfovibrionales bacterium]|nr:tyrosine-type recombinase/integrase [Thermodesulfovibrionales bacterium]
MKGKVRTREICPQCRGKFKIVEGIDIFCERCNTRPKTFFIVLYHDKAKQRISREKDGQILDSYRRAHRLLENIRKDYDDGVFSLSNYLPEEIEEFRGHKLFPKWLGTKTLIAPSSLREYKRYTELYFVPYFGNQDMRQLNAGHIEDFFLSIPKAQEEHGFRQLSLKSLKNISIALHTFCVWLYTRETIKRVPVFPKITPPKPPIDWITRNEQMKILAFINSHHRPIFEFLYYHPVRVGEARALRRKHFKLDIMAVHVCEAFSLKETRSRKNKEPYYLPIAKRFNLDVLKDKLPEAFVFTNKAGRPYTSEGLRKIWHRATKKAGLRIQLKNATRHSGASQSINAGIDLATISKSLGHATLQITKDKYASMNIELLRAVVDRDNVVEFNEHVVSAK